MSETVNQRAQHVLKTLVERYIQDGSPVGSKTLAEESSLGLSSATIRNILADLEEAGYLVSPHTSAGRVPTSLGYRYFVNSLLTVKPFEQMSVDALKGQLDPDLAVPNLIQSASSLLSGLTQLTGIVTLPKRNRNELRQVEFLALSGTRVLVILVVNGREVQNRVIHTDRVYSQSALQEAANYLNSHYIGKDLLAIRQALLEAMRHDREDLNAMLLTTLEVANKAFRPMEEAASDYVVAGQDKLFMNYSREGNVDRLRALFEAFTKKQEILGLLDCAIDAQGIQIFIGSETGCEAFDECSIVTASYAVDGQLIGSLGVIGPQRMPYDRVISAVDVTAKLLSSALNHV